MPATITVYDGTDTIGGNKILLEDGDASLWLDFGASSHARNLYFEEFLAPRSRTGLLDLVQMGLLPPLRGIYRADMEDPDGRVWDRAGRFSHFRECRADAVLLSHAHLDHCGYISFLDPFVPIVCTAMTAYLCKAIQDCGAHQFEGEVCYAIPKQATDEGTLGALPARDFPFQRRPYLLTDEVPADPERFWNLPPSAPRGRYFPSQTLRVADRIAGLRVRFLPVDHSIHGSAAVAVETSSGWVVYTGDLRRHGRDRALTDAFVREARALDPVALVCEGTNVDRGPGPTEEEVMEACLRTVQDAHGEFVVADFGPRNVERLLIFLEIARRTGRRLAVTEKDAYMLAAMHVVDPAIPTPVTEPALTIYRRALLKPQTWVKFVRHRYPDHVTAAHVNAHPGDYLLCMSFFDITELIDIDPVGGIWIYSASEPHDEEQQFEMQRLRNWLVRFGLTPVGLTDLPSPYHASGHISGPELRDLIEEIGPRRVIPVHTARPADFLNLFRGTDVVLPQTGVPIPLGA
ncbi:MAG: MBL fold metallo-hydrolase RNA specificity domain-containing protein [Armatimonadota bacterium]|nr:MBL fold metallo-hydrolase RNA specificity domain-containing protein [Armatimonadota bacterium]